MNGQPATAVISVTNVGTGPCKGPTQVSESLPAGLSLVSAVGSGWTCSGGNCTYNAFLNPGASASITFNFIVDAKPGTGIQNCAKLGNDSDTNPANNQACAEVSVGDSKPEPPDLAIEKNVKCLMGPAVPKCTITFKIVNNGPGSFNGFLTVQDLITPTPAFLVLAPASNNPPGWTCSINPSNTIGCSSTGPISLGTTILSVDVSIAQGQYENCATVTGYKQAPLEPGNVIKEDITGNNRTCVKIAAINSSASVTLEFIKSAFQSWLMVFDAGI